MWLIYRGRGGGRSRILAAQHRNDMADAKTLFYAGHARQYLLSRHQGAGNLLHVAEAEVASVARFGRVSLTEMFGQVAMPTDRPAR